MTGDPFMKFKPVDDFILVETIKVESKEAKKMKELDLVGMDGAKPKNELLTPMAKLEEVKNKMLEEWEEHPFQGYVKAVGNGRYLEDDVKIPMNVKVGDRIAFRLGSGEAFVYRNKFYLMIKQHDVFGIYDENFVK